MDIWIYKACKVEDFTKIINDEAGDGLMGYWWGIE